MLIRKMKPIAAVVGAAFAASLATGALADETAIDPFAAEELDGVLLADAHGGEGKCGEGKCGDEDKGDGEGDGDDSEDTSEDSEEAES